MKEKKLYTCEFCKTDYAERLQCQKCEKNHKAKLEFVPKRYLPFGVDNSGMPIEIEVKAEDGKRYRYKRG